MLPWRAVSSPSAVWLLWRAGRAGGRGQQLLPVEALHVATRTVLQEFKEFAAAQLRSKELDQMNAHQLIALYPQMVRGATPVRRTK